MHSQFRVAQLAELVDALDSNSSAARRAGSIPALGTIPADDKFAGFFIFILNRCRGFVIRVLITEKHGKSALSGNSNCDLLAYRHCPAFVEQDCHS